MATLIGTNSNNTLTGTASADTMVGRAGNDQLLGNGGNDRLNGGTQNDTLNGGAGIDTADYSNLVIGGLTYIGATAGVTVNLNIASAQNTVGAGTDTLVSMENLIGTNFDDKLAGNGAANVLTGLGGNDIMAGAAGNDQLSGGDGNDLLNGGTGNDLLNGGAGIDAADYGPFVIGGQTVSGGTAGVTVNLNLTGAQNTVGAGTDTLVGMENVYGSSFNDTLMGNSANNFLTGRAGNDTLIGGAGDDVLRDDAGDDLLDGGIGSDTASYTNATAGVTVYLGQSGVAQNTGGAGTDTLVNIENLLGSNFNDILNNAEFGNSTLSGGAGNDLLSSDHSDNITLNGDNGNDTLYAFQSTAVTLNGGAGDDQLHASDGAFKLNGGDGNDELIIGTFGTGYSTLNGGGGADTIEILVFDNNAPLTFDYNAVSESPAGAGKDTIIGFNGGDIPNVRGYQIDLTTIDANTLVSGNQAFTYIGSASFTAAGQLRYAGGLLQGSTDSDTAAEFEIQLVGSPALTVGGAGTDILL